MEQVKREKVLKTNEGTLVKMSAAGNRFLIVDKRVSEVFSRDSLFISAMPFDLKEVFSLSERSLEERTKFLKKLQFGNHKDFDGLVVIKESDKYPLVCDFFNCDGSFADMCGNAACCLAFYGKELMRITEGSSFKFLFGKKLIVGEYENNQIWIKINSPKVEFFSKPFIFQNRSYSYSLIISGVPHGVIKKEGPLLTDSLRPVASMLRYKNPKSEFGMNVSFYSIQEKNHLEALTYERGVEDFTLSCGTGAVAVALAFSEHRNNAKEKVTVQMPGGMLTVKLQPEVKLSSPAQWGWQISR